MKLKAIVGAMVLGGTLLASGVRAEPYVLDQRDPASVVGAIFYAATMSEWDLLKGLCDPKGESDGDTKRICGVAAAEDASKSEFAGYFKTGKLNGAAIIEGDKAEVPFLFGPDGTKPETMVLVNRDGLWYLASF